MIQSVKNILLYGTADRPMALDIFFDDTTQQRPVIIYAHGFNGFKDWGNFDLIATIFARAGYVFVKFNFSHNGTTPGQPEEFADLEAFGNNNYTKQLLDLRVIADWVCHPLNPYARSFDHNLLYLMGHSMGGGISILYAAGDRRVKKLITWASIGECTTPWGNWPADKMVQWKETGVQYYTNSRTKQQMPLYYQLYEDFIRNKERLSIQNAIKGLDIPILACHGTLDTSVPVETVWLLRQWQPSVQVFTVDSDHVFGRKHPWAENHLPSEMTMVLEACLTFLE